MSENKDKNPVGRPKKYFTEEELKQAKKIYNSSEEEKQRRREYKKKWYDLSAICECGGKFIYTPNSKHYTSKKHLDYEKLIKMKKIIIDIKNDINDIKNDIN